MSQSLSDVQQEYLRSQLRYDHRDDLPPPNTLAVHQIQHEMIRNTVRDFSTQHEVHMLDIGCGWGDFSNQLDPYLKSYVGIEPSPIELGRFQKRPNRSIICGVGEYTDYLKDCSRNFVLLNSVLDHCYDWRKTFANCLRILAPGGLMIISMENSQKLIVRVRKFFGHADHTHHGHLEFFGVDDTRKFLEPNFQILKQRTIGFLYGMHAVTQKVPLPVGPLRFLNRAVNGVCRVVAPKGGHIFFISALRHGSMPTTHNFATPFRCPKCQADWAFGSATCGACGLSFPYGPNGFLDYVEMNPELKAILKPDAKKG